MGRETSRWFRRMPRSFKAFFTTLLFMPMACSLVGQGLDAPVKYTARDSIRYDLREQKVYLFGAARVTYDDIELTAERIEYHFGPMEVRAFGSPDTAGKVAGLPVFSQGGHSFEADSVRYSFHTGKGYIREVRTSEAEAYVQARLSKRQASGEVHSRGGLLTTCDRPKPHYHFRTSRMIVVPDDKIVAGPAVMRVGRVPTFIAIPFALFPNKRGGTTGILLPTYGESAELGFFLLNGGYYVPLSERVDVQLTGDVYSKGSWGLKALTRYRTRYRYSGALDLSHNTLLNGLPEAPGFHRQRNFFVRWNHLVDPKASLTDRFSASVNLGTSGNFTNNFNSTTGDFLSNTFQSNIGWSRIWPGRPFNLGVNLRHAQNTLNRTFDITLPSVAFNVTRIFPFQRRGLVGTPRWYEQIGLNYALNFDNRLSTTEDQLYGANLPNLFARMRNGIRHTAALNTSFKTRYFTLNPEVRITDRMYFDQLRRTLVDTGDTLYTVTDTISRFAAPFEWSAGVTLTSKVYGMYQFRGGKVRAIRHVLTPSAGLSYRPDFSTRIEGPFGPGGATASYSPFDIGIYGKPAEGESGLLTLGLVQSLEAKVRKGKRTTPEEGEPETFNKVKLLDFVGITTSYDWLRDSLRWSPVNVSARTSLFNVVNVNFTSLWDPYATDTLGQRIERMQQALYGELARLTNLNAAVGFDLKSRRYGQSDDGGSRVVEEADPQKGARTDFRIPWRLGVNYSYDLSRSYFGPRSQEIDRQSVLFNGDVTLFKHWKLGASSGYDLSAQEWTPTSLNLYWDLHCWEFNFNVIPMGLRKSFSFRINVKASILRDLKIEQRRPIGGDPGLLY